MSINVIAERDFVIADQEQFAAISGDRNPMHMDALVARRTMAGFPVVHGIHTLLWSLDNLFRYLPHLVSVASIKVRFQKMVYVGDHVQAVLVQRDEQKLRVEVVVEGVTVMSIQVVFGNARPSNDTTSDEPLLQPTKPMVLSFEQMIDNHGRIPFFSPPDDVSRMFPAAARVLGAQRAAGLACSSYLVGMVCPGLHSIYAGLNFVTTSLGKGDHDTLHFRVTSNDPRFRLIKLAVSGAGWTGSIDAHARPEPAVQPGLPSFATKVAPREFSGASVLVVGGSRGLGELIAKILAAGSAYVTLTYSVGEMDARRVQTEIVANGGRCDVIHYDVRANPREQLALLRTIPNEIYYLATPTIFQRKSAVFIQKRLDEFLAFYVSGFYNLCKELRSKSATDISVFYPSSVFLDARSGHMTEYAMAKAAGEVLCADMQSFERPGPILVRRLPRLSTDQTAALVQVELTNSIDVILPIIREVHTNSKRP